MAKYNYKCVDCSEKFVLEVTKDKKPKLLCPKCQSGSIKADYEQPEIPEKFEKDNIRIFCALK
ncbi:MAG: hypothetical protein VR72_13355 [Clostridiaceae bacterium BRH_c20a]|nr:MAG: hypothetical protein VR72_13355 [Clostridiaceae bacterium BRH_c20a]